MPIVIPTQSYPLRWPIGVPRATSRGRSSFVLIEAGRAIREVYDELRRARATRIVISSNMPTNRDGTPSADTTQRPGGDPGIAVYWTISKWRAGKVTEIPHCMPCDKWDRISCNLHAVALSIEAMRGMERWGAVTIEQAFAGFAALPAGAEQPQAPTVRPWRDVIGGAWPEDLEAADVLALARARHRKAIAEAHPDRGGSHERAAELNAALTEAERELGGPR